MKQSAYERARDERVADEAGDPALRCPARGCPRRWTVSGDRGKACGAHYWAEPVDWPRITEQLLREQTERAMARADPAPPVPMPRERREAILAQLQAFSASSDPRAWARRLRDRHQRGERLTREQIEAYQRALPETRKVAE